MLHLDDHKSRAEFIDAPKLDHLILGAILFSFSSQNVYANEPAFSCEQAKAEAFAPNEIDAYVQRRMQRDHIPGVSVAILRDGKVIHCKGYGMANVELLSAATESSVYQIASLTKPFTATAIMLLVEDGKLNIDVRVTKYLPDLPTSWENVTVRQLLGHTSGIKNLTDLSGFAETVRKDFTPRELVDMVAKEPLDFEPGENWNYSNTGYIALGMLIEKLSGKSYGLFMDERIFKPLGMTNTRAERFACSDRWPRAGLHLGWEGPEDRRIPQPNQAVAQGCWSRP